ncbi:MAG: helix-turn-helix domain-containing protein [Pseudonocardia sp.]|nr:helix-turn-helix domain-containing protein [Pseudonocardia sp.]
MTAPGPPADSPDSRGPDTRDPDTGRADTGRADTRRPGLRAARAARGWSQSDAARELAALGRARGAPTAVAASLKTQLSRWENGHATPDPPSRALLAELYDTDEAALGLVPRGPAPTGPAPTRGRHRLAAALAEAAAVDDSALDLLGEQLRLAGRLDHRLGPAGAGEVLEALVARLTVLTDHTVVPGRRRAVAALLAEAAALAGDLALERGAIDEAWERHGRSRAAALEAGHEVLADRAIAGRASALREAGLHDDALRLLEGHAGVWPVLARGEVHAAAGRTSAARTDFATAEAGATRRAHPRPDVVVPALAIDVGLVHRRRDRALARSGDPVVLDALRVTAEDGERPVRERLAATTGLALGLAHGGPGTEGARREAAERRREALLLGLRIGADAVRATLSAGSAAQDPG